MGFLRNLLNAKLEKRDDNSDPFVDALVSITSSDTGVFVGAGALKNSDIFSAIRKISGDIASTKIIYNDNSTQGNRLTNLLNKAPNSNQNAWSFWFAEMASCLLNGNSFAQIKRNNSGQVTALLYIPNDEMTVTQNDETGVLTYHYKNKNLKSSEVLHFKCFVNPDGYTGVSPIYALRDQISIQHSKDDTLANYFKNGYIGKSILTINGADLSAEAKNEIRDKFVNANNSASGVIVLDQNTSYSNLKVDESVFRIANETNWTTRQVASAFGLSPNLLGVEDEHSNNEQSMLNYIQSTLSYYFRCITSELDFKLASANYSFNFDTSNFFSTDPNTTNVIHDRYINDVKGGIMTPNEARSKLGLAPIEGGDKLQGLDLSSADDNSKIRKENE